MTDTIDTVDTVDVREVAPSPPPAGASPCDPGAAPARRGRLGRLWRGRADDPAWVRPALLALLAATAVLYLWGLDANGWANSYYTAAVQAGSRSWKAFLYGSTDASNFVTVDKTPASLWPAALSVRVFGLNSWSVLAPQALEGVAAVGLLYLAIRRWFGPAAGLLAGAVLATTPVAALMFRYNNPDSLLVLCLVAAAYFVTRAMEDERWRWMVAAGAAVGLAFLAKELQAFLVLPGFAVAFLVAGPGTLARRVARGAAMAASMAVTAGWWLLLVTVVPASDRPYIGGSQDDTIWNVLFGYNGFGRLTGNEAGSVGGGPQGAGGRWGPTGWTRMFNSQFGFEASWLLPAALVLLVVGLAVTLGRRRTDRTRAALVVWGGWLLVTGAAFSLGQGIIHEYYAVALAPAIGAVVGIGSHLLWTHRRALWARLAMIVTLAVSVWWVVRLLDRAPQWHPALATLLVVGAGLAAAGLLVVDRLGRMAAAVAIGVVVVALAAPAAASVTTARAAHDGPLPTSGPAHTTDRFGPGGGRGGFPGGGVAGAPPGGLAGRPGGGGSGGPGGLLGGPPPFGPGGGAGAGRAFGGFAGGPGAGGGGVFGSPTPGPEITELLAGARDGGYRWAAATVGATNAAGFQIASGEPIMAIGGFNGSDPTPTLAEFQALVAAGDVHYFIGTNFGVPGGPAGERASIADWVAESFTAQTVSGVTIYDLSAAAGTSV